CGPAVRLFGHRHYLFHRLALVDALAVAIGLERGSCRGRLKAAANPVAGRADALLEQTPLLLREVYRLRSHRLMEGRGDLLEGVEVFVSTQLIECEAHRTAVAAFTNEA